MKVSVAFLKSFCKCIISVSMTKVSGLRVSYVLFSHMADGDHLGFYDTTFVFGYLFSKVLRSFYIEGKSQLYHPYHF